MVCVNKVPQSRLIDPVLLPSFTVDQEQFFYQLTPDVVLNAVEQYGVRCTGRILQLNSMENRVFEVEIEPTEQYPNQQFVISKFYRPGRWTKEQIFEEHQFLYDLFEAEIPVGAPCKDKSGSTLLSIPDQNIYFSLFQKIRGRTPQEFFEEEYIRLGRLIARVHIAGAKQKAPHRLHITPEQYGMKNLSFLIDSKILPKEIEDDYKNTVIQLCETIYPWFENIESIRIHGDLHLANILSVDEQFQLVDFDDMVMGPPVQDIWLILPGRDEEAKIMLSLLLEGYEEIRKFDRSTLRLIEPLRTLRMIHFSAWIARRWEDPSFKRVFDSFGTTSYWQGQLADLKDQLQVMSDFSWSFAHG